LILKCFAAFSQIGFFGLLSLLLASLMMIAAYWYTKRRLILTSSIIIAIATAIVLTIDVYTYKVSHYHLNGIILNLIFNGLINEVFTLSHNELIFALSIFLFIIIIEILYGLALWRAVDKNWGFVYKKWFILLVAVCFYLSYSMLVYSQQYQLHRILVDISRVLPYYANLQGLLMFGKNGIYKINHFAEEHCLQAQGLNLPLNYPLTKLQPSSAKNNPNILIIVIDSWRFDMLSRDITPNLYQFAGKSWVFKNHFSGGNATGPGIFSLLYGLPYSYWSSMEIQQRGPVFIDELNNQGYDMGIFASASLSLPPFDKTVFSGVNHLQINTQGDSPYQRDLTITDNFKKFISKTKKPFFSFLFYDAAHGFCSFDEDLKPFIPVVKNCDRSQLTHESDPTPYFNRYKNALQLVDKEIGKVITYLDEKNLLQNTIILITADHGEEFNDGASGYWGHANHFSDYQVKVPLIVHWPKQSPKEFMHTTSHYDVVPTLMKQGLGFNNFLAHYSIGSELLDTTRRPYLIINSYVDFAVITNNRRTRILSNGNYIIETNMGETLFTEKLDIPIIHQAYEDLRRFYQNQNI